MSLIRPFPGLRPAPGRAADVIAPPYDVLSSDEARARAAGKPRSFLHISKAEIDLPPVTDPYDAVVYAKARENFDRLCKEGVLARDPEPYYYFYRLVMGPHTQVGLVAAASIAAYEAGRIRRHEFTRPDKEDDRVRQIDALNAQTGPVFLTYRHSVKIDAMAEIVTRGKPDVDVTADDCMDAGGRATPGAVADDGVRHSLWPVRDRKLIQALTAAFDALERLYIADGHHRSAAASRVAAARRAANPKHTGEEAYNYFLAVVFPRQPDADSGLQPRGERPERPCPRGVSEKTRWQFQRAARRSAVKPACAGEFGMYLKGQWYRLAIRPERIRTTIR